jgi:hypothetical protein
MKGIRIDLLMMLHTSGTSFDLGPHPADPHATSPPMVIIDRNEPVGKSNGRTNQVEGVEIHVYADQTGCVPLVCSLKDLVEFFSRSFTFWRFFLEVPLADNGQEITYHINNGQRMHFHVPGRNQNMRWAAYSVSFYASLNPETGCE